MPERLNPQIVKTELEALIKTASVVEPNLAERLKNLKKWIAKKQDGLLISKTHVLDLLTELILDCQFWLNHLKSLTPEQKQLLYAQEQITPVEQYWYDFLFPKWFNERDPKLPRWKQKIMNNQFTRNDEKIVNSLANEIEASGGSCLWKYLLDLSMATDLVVVGNKGIPLCVQLTQTYVNQWGDKRKKWEGTLDYWGIQRGLIISYNPGNLNTAFLASAIVEKADTLPDISYNEYTA